MKSTILFFVALVIAGASSLHAQSVYLRTKNPASPIDDHTARRVGDLLTITILETHKVKNEDKVNRTASSSLKMRLEEYNLSRDTFIQNTPAEVRRQIQQGSDR